MIYGEELNTSNCNQSHDVNIDKVSSNRAIGDMTVDVGYCSKAA